ncbi:amino acid ABC transporter permease/ATP-binding protein [Mycolicibacterium neworleansense]|uniref:Polar amino acid ABC transporter inner membrane subunit n=1 Tax=Mycolicibacterium neworleansense TaxID=146018 RepID=A0A0H5RT80_9MYCO|nr:amino acid ABC transporter permease/ATP-binding protein [Mycolicibacterium neworleansense]MCV7361360.1 amino acid ABC transporter permease/ATP-binding protein [Mycolicibacterium neworleansense]CRZ16707.1 polar amino acid ABC transporter inner membrane subunit [Mycolicibacterium neworleansense]
MDKFLHYLTLPWLLDGMLFTLQLTLYGFGGGIVLGALLAALQLTRSRTLTALGRTYVVIYRGTPLILQLVFVFTALPHIGITLPPLAAGSVALAMNEAVFVSEILRSGIKGVDPGQSLAGRALGLEPRKLMRRVIAPQAFRSMIPALGNEFVSTMKNSALASVIAVPELTLRTQQLASATFDYFSIYFATAVMYLALTAVLSVIQLILEDALNLDRDRRSLLSRLGLRRRVSTSAPLPDSVTAVPVPAGRQDIGDTILEIRDLHKAYGENQVLNGITVSVRQGEVIALLGPSGSGKSTLLRTINHLESIDSGSVRIAGQTVGYSQSGTPLPEGQIAQARIAAGIGMVFQHFNLFKHMTVRENIAAPLRWIQRLSKEEAAERADLLLSQVGLADKAGALPHRLSGGQQQRVGIARALAARPRILLLDEPTSALDPELVAEVLGVIRGLAHHHGLTMIIATHQLRFALEVADRVVFMAGGVVVEEGTADQVITRPQHPVTARFVNAMHLADA